MRAEAAKGVTREEEFALHKAYMLILWLEFIEILAGDPGHHLGQSHARLVKIGERLRETGNSKMVEMLLRPGFRVQAEIEKLAYLPRSEQP